MFTGLIQHMGEIASREARSASTRLVVRVAGWDQPIRVGDSIAVNGVCLTAAELGAGCVHFDVVPETLRMTTLGRLDAGSRVNLEASVTPTTLMGGHLVQGHVDGVGRIEQVGGDGEYRLRIGVPADLMECMIPKGSVAVEGVSLTLAAVEPAAEAIEIALIPVTLAATTLGGLRAGSHVNLECDLIARTAVHWFRNYASLEGAKGVRG
jgi:riboflavin synthase